MRGDDAPDENFVYVYDLKLAPELQQIIYLANPKGGPKAGAVFSIRPILVQLD